MKQLSLIMLALFMGCVTFAQTHPYKEKFHFTLGQQDTVGGYTQVIRTGNTIYVSGTVATNITEKDVSYVYKVIEKSLAHFGASLKHVMKETIYTTDIEAMKALNHVRKKPIVVITQRLPGCRFRDCLCQKLNWKLKW